MEEESVAWMIIKTILVLALFVGGFYMFFKFVTPESGAAYLRAGGDTDSFNGFCRYK